jgi:hypothetical protein
VSECVVHFTNKLVSDFLAVAVSVGVGRAADSQGLRLLLQQVPATHNMTSLGFFESGVCDGDARAAGPGQSSESELPSLKPEWPPAIERPGPLPSPRPMSPGPAPGARARELSSEMLAVFGVPPARATAAGRRDAHIPTRTVTVAAWPGTCQR